VTVPSGAGLMSPPRRRLISTAPGTRTGDFGPAEWGLLAAIAAIWGSSFLFIAIGLESFRPGLITWLRLLFGAATLGLVPAARRPLDRADTGRIILLGFTWMAVPLYMFPVAQQWIDSSLAGMLNGSVPLFAAVVGAVLLRRAPGSKQILGLVLGFAGVVAVSWPAVQGAKATAFGAALILFACLGYGLSANMAVPLQQRYGALPVLWRVQMVAVLAVAPFGLGSIPGSTFAWGSLAAVAALGILGTGWAFVALGTLVGRAGATRGVVSIYFIPVVAIFLGVVFLHEAVPAISLVGTGLVLCGAYFVSRRET
jgi:drug/metabolite transporter (DMT)-like permease